jgi:dynein heavy chain
VQLKEQLEKYDKENMTIDIINKLKKYVAEPWFNAQEMQKKSQAASGLCAFVNAMYKFYFVNLNVIPKR